MDERTNGIVKNILGRDGQTDGWTGDRADVWMDGYMNG